MEMRHEDSIVRDLGHPHTRARIGCDFRGGEESCSGWQVHLGTDLRGRLQHHGLVLSHGLHRWKMDEARGWMLREFLRAEMLVIVAVARR